MQMMRKCLLAVVLIPAVALLSACTAETQPPTDFSADAKANTMTAVLHSKVTVRQGERGHIWFEVCSFYPWSPQLVDCEDQSDWSTRVGYTDWGPAGRDLGPVDYRARVTVPYAILELYRVCGDLTGDGWQTPPVCFDSRGDVVKSTTDPQRDYDGFGIGLFRGEP
jgi:hypothetical protein